MNLKFMIYCRGKHASIGKVNEVQNDMGNDEDITEMSMIKNIKHR